MRHAYHSTHMGKDMSRQLRCNTMNRYCHTCREPETRCLCDTPIIIIDTAAEPDNVTTADDAHTDQHR